MANQIIIDIGAVANDGTGDPLRTAFGYVNDNFSNVWATGVANANIGFSGNKILTVNTNGNLVLAPNGTGKVIANVDIVPNTANVRNLGAINNRWSTVYSQYLNVSNDVDFTGDVTVGGNLTVTGNTIQIGNITTETKTIQLANSASTANAANGSGVTVGANDNIATMLYNSTSNTWVMNIGANITGNVTAPYFIGNGSQLTGINTSPAGSNTQIQFNDGGVFGADADFYFRKTTNTLVVNGGLNEHSVELGNQGFTDLNSNVIAQITGNANSYTQVNFQNINSGTRATTDYIATAAFGTDSTYFVDMGIASNSYDNTNPDNSLGNALYAQDSYLYSMGANNYGGSGGNLVVGSNEPGGVVRVIADGSFTSNIVATFSNVGIDVKGNIIPVTSNTYSLGNSTNQWSDLYVSNATIYMNNVPISLTAGNVLTVNGADVVTTNANGQANIGNLDITGTYVSIASGASETIITLSPNIEGQAYLQMPNDATANVANVRLHNDVGNIELGTGSGSYNWYFDNTGNLSVPVNINFNGGGLQQVVNEDFYVRASDNESDGWSIYNVVDDGAGNDLTQTRLEYNQFSIRTNIQGATSHTWQFNDSGTLGLPGNIFGNYGGNLFINIGDQFGSTTFIDLRTTSYVGDALISNIRIGDPNITISTASGGNTWNFDNAGTLTFPSLANISGGNFNAGTASATVALNAFSPDGNTVSIQAQGNSSSAVISIFSNAGPVTNNWTFTQAELDPTEAFLYVPPGASISTPNATGGQGGKNIFIQAGASDPVTWNSNPGGELFIKGGYGSFGDGGGGPGGNVNINGGESSDSHAGNVNIASGLNTWVFDYTGDLTAPGNIATDWLNISNVGNIARLEADVLLQITTNAASNTAPSWTFNTDGTLFVPGNIAGDNNGPLIIDGNGSGIEGYISLPASNFGGEQITIVNEFTLGNGISLVTNGGEWHFGNSGAFTSPGAITATGTVSGQVLISTQSAANEGGEIQLALPSSGTTLTGNVIIDSYQNSIRFFESGNSRGMYVDVPNVSVSGQYAIGYRDVPQIALSGNVTANSITAGKHFYSTTAGNLQVTIPDNANVAFPLGATLTIVMNAAGNVIVAQGTGVSLYMAGSSSTGNRTVGAYGLASVMKVATDTWVISGTGVY